MAVAAQRHLHDEGINGLHHRLEDLAGRPLAQPLHDTLKREARQQVSRAVAAFADSRAPLSSRVPLSSVFMARVRMCRPAKTICNLCHGSCFSRQLPKALAAAAASMLMPLSSWLVLP